MTTVAEQPKGMTRPKQWSQEVEENYRFQLAGYRDEIEYKSVKGEMPNRWPENGYIKKLQRKDGLFYYFNRTRECEDKDVPRTKMYTY
ncbi:meiosis expressed gene 1 protein homolog [Diadema antillarum]|uniref:meiosis expressed gene 1 protein homolog n=1 Tax=Diadema antillarum TaxID=105358 RepID=UPI003A8C3E3E